MFIKIIKIACVATFALLLNACVSITETRYSKNTNPEKAAETYVALAVGYLSQGNMILARQKLDRALELNPENPAVHSALAMYWLERGEIKLAEQEFGVALDLDDEHSPSNYHYGLYLMRYKKDQKACGYLAIAASLACGLLGIKAQLQPDEPVVGAASAYDDPVEVARSLEEALRLLQQCSELKEIMGDKFVEAFIAVKRTESEAFHQVISPWEREFLLLSV